MSAPVDILAAMKDAATELPMRYAAPLDEACTAVAELIKRHNDLRWLLVRAMAARTEDTPKSLVEDAFAALARGDAK